YLMFLSDRDFNPTFSNVEFQISYSNLTKIYLVTLSKDTPSPFAPENNEVKTAQDSSSSPASSSKNKNEKSKSSTITASSSDVKVDLDGIMNRIIALPIDASQYFNIDYANGNIYYQGQKAGEDKSTLYIFKLKDRKQDV